MNTYLAFARMGSIRGNGRMPLGHDVVHGSSFVTDDRPVSPDSMQDARFHGILFLALDFSIRDGIASTFAEDAA